LQRRLREPRSRQGAEAYRRVLWALEARDGIYGGNVGRRIRLHLALVAVCAIEQPSREIPLTVFPLSNVKLAVFKKIDDHNIKRFLDKGLCVTVNSDAPAYFGGYIADNFIAIQRALNLTATDIGRLTGNSIRVSFLPEADKKAWLAKIEAQVSAHVV